MFYENFPCFLWQFVASISYTKRSCSRLISIAYQMFFGIPGITCLLGQMKAGDEIITSVLRYEEHRVITIGWALNNVQALQVIPNHFKSWTPKSWVATTWKGPKLEESQRIESTVLASAAKLTSDPSKKIYVFDCNYLRRTSLYE